MVKEEGAASSMEIAIHAASMGTRRRIVGAKVKVEAAREKAKEVMEEVVTEDHIQELHAPEEEAAKEEKAKVKARVKAGSMGIAILVENSDIKPQTVGASSE